MRSSLAVKRIGRLPNYVQRFGLFHGVRLLVKNEKRWSHVSETVRTISVPGYPSPIHLRDSISDHATFWQCIVRRQYDLEHFPHYRRLFDFYSDSIKKGLRPLIIDAGANIGLSVLWYARAFPEALIIAIEPDEANFGILQRNVAALGDRVRALRGGVWSGSTALEIVDPTAGSSAIRVRAVRDQSARSIRAYGLNELLGGFPDTAPFIVKLDVEGSQAQVFQERTEWLSKVQAVVLELDDWLFPWGGTSRAFFRAIASLPYEYLLSGELIVCFRDAN